MDIGDPISISLILFLQIIMLNAAFALDNVLILLLATDQLNREDTVKALIAGVSGAVVLRMVFAVMIAVSISFDKVPLSFIGGVILLMITMKFTENETARKKGNARLLAVVLAIILGDLSMSFDNTIAIIVIAKGNLPLLVAGLLTNIPIMLAAVYTGDKLVNKFPGIIYFAASFLCYTACDMMLSDQWLNAKVNLVQYHYACWILAGIVFAYGIVKTIDIKKTKDILVQKIGHCQNES